MEGHQQSMQDVLIETKLMKREREVADFEARMKKTEFKHNRDIKEAKMAEDRAKNLLKDEKSKVDRLSKVAKQRQEQNILLNRRITQLREQKERDVLEVRGQYNSLKEELRSYERVLPTLTFMNQLGLRMGSIPTYEEVFLGLRDKIVLLEETEAKFKKYRQRSEKQMVTLKQNEQLFRVKTQETQRRLKEVMSRLVQQQQILSECKGVCDQQRQTIEHLKDELKHLEDKSQGLQSTIREYQLKLQQLDRAYSCELLSKEQEIKALTQQQFQRYEGQIRSLQNRLQIKDKMYVQQLTILQQEVYYLQGRISEEKEQFQENYQVIKAEIQRMREQVERERFQHEELKHQHSNISSQFVSTNKTKQLLQTRVAVQDKTIEGYRELQKKKTQTFSDVQVSQIDNLQQSYTQLMNRYELVTSRINHFELQNKTLEQEVAMLRSELITNSTPKGHRLELPTNFLQLEEAAMRKSIQSAHSDWSDHSQELITERRLSQELTKQLKETEKEKKELKEKDQKSEDILTVTKKERDQLKVDNIGLRQKVSELTSSLSQKEQGFSNVTKNFNLLKSKEGSLQKQIVLYTDENKREKDINKALREELKQLKETHALQTQKHIREKKEINSQFEVYKVERDKLKSQYTLRQKSLSGQINTLKNSLQMEQNNKLRLQETTRQAGMVKEERETLGGKVQTLTKELEKMTKENEKIREDFRRKERQNKNLQQMLARERKERSLLSVPSLEQIDTAKIEQKTFNDIYSIVTQKESQINFLQREVSDLRQDLQGMRQAHHVRVNEMEIQQNDYIQTIIEMKMRCAQSEMKAAEIMHLYSQLKKKFALKA